MARWHNVGKTVCGVRHEACGMRYAVRGGLGPPGIAHVNVFLTPVSGFKAAVSKELLTGSHIFAVVNP